MGQQQLLLVILVTILVGIATVVAINIFGTAADQANRDAVRQDLLSAVAQGQAIWQRPAAMGGSGGTFDEFDDIRRLNIPRGSGATDTYTAETIINENGTYTISSASGNNLELEGLPSSGGEVIRVLLTRVVVANEPDRWTITWDGDTIAD